MLPNPSMHPNHSMHPSHTVQPIFVSAPPPRQGPLATIAAALGGALAASGVLVLLLLHHVADVQGSQQASLEEATAALWRAEQALGAALARAPEAEGPRSGPARAPLGVPAPVAVPVISHAALACADDHCTIHPEGLDLLLRPESLARSARVIPLVVDGEARGMKLYGIRSGSVPRLLGFKNGDLVRAVNGQPLTVESALGLYEALRERRLGRLAVEIERRGVVMTRTFAIG